MESEILHKGFLKKQKGPLGRWLKRHFSLYSSGVVVYRKKEKSEILGSFTVNGARCYSLPDQTCWFVETSTRKWNLQAEDQKSLLEWKNKCIQAKALWGQGDIREELNKQLEGDEQFSGLEEKILSAFCSKPFLTWRTFVNVVTGLIKTVTKEDMNHIKWLVCDEVDMVKKALVERLFEWFSPISDSPENGFTMDRIINIVQQRYFHSFMDSSEANNILEKSLEEFSYLFRFSNEPRYLACSFVQNGNIIHLRISIEATSSRKRCSLKIETENRDCFYNNLDEIASEYNLSKPVPRVVNQKSFEVIEVPLNSLEFNKLNDEFRSDLQGQNEDYNLKRIKQGMRPLTFVLLSACRIVNTGLEDAFNKCVEEIAQKRDRVPEQIREQRAYHGTSPLNLASIAQNGLLKIGNPKNPSKAIDTGYFGDPKMGVYVSRYIDYALKYSNGLQPLKQNETALCLRFKCVPGKSRRIPETSPGIYPSHGFDSHISPRSLEWYLFEESQVCPQYLLEVKAVEGVVCADDGRKSFRSLSLPV